MQNRSVELVDVTAGVTEAVHDGNRVGDLLDSFAVNKIAVNKILFFCESSYSPAQGRIRQ